MSARAYYCEIDSWCCDVLRGLIAAGEIPDGDVDNRDIRLVQPHELEGYGQIHLFAGIGGGPLACRLAGLPDDFPIITAGVPCQPASQAGKRLGADDERWLWPEFFRLLRYLRSHYALVEQPPGIVSLNAGREWRWVLGELAEIVSDLEVSRVSAADVGAPQERERVWIVAYADIDGWRSELTAREARCGRSEPSRNLARLGNATSGGRRAGGRESVRRVGGGCASVGDTSSAGREERDAAAEPTGARHAAGERASLGEPGRGSVQHRDDARSACVSGREDEGEGVQRERCGGDARDYGELLRPWDDAVPVRGADGSVRLIPREAAEAGPESPLWPVADGIPGRVARLRAIGNAWVPQAAVPALRVILEHARALIAEGR